MAHLKTLLWWAREVTDVHLIRNNEQIFVFVCEVVCLSVYLTILPHAYIDCHEIWNSRTWYKGRAKYTLGFFYFHPVWRPFSGLFRSYRQTSWLIFTKFGFFAYLTDRAKRGICFDLSVRHLRCVFWCLSFSRLRPHAFNNSHDIWNQPTLIRRWSDLHVRIFSPSRFKIATILWVFFAVKSVERGLWILLK